MGRKATITYEQVKAIVDALRAEGARPTIDRVWEALDKAGSKGTVHKLVKQYLAELEPAQKTPESLRLLPPEVQQVILAFADHAASTARERIADELVGCMQEASSLADDNERLTAEVDGLRTQLAHAASEKAAAEGRAAQIANELATARERIELERAAAEQARTALAKAELRLESVAPLEVELRQTRAERDAQRDARTEAERVAAVLDARQKEHEERIQEIRSSLASSRDACARLETKNCELADALERERQARGAAESKLAVLTATQPGRPGAAVKPRRKHAVQGALWQGGGDAPGGVPGVDVSGT